MAICSCCGSDFDVSHVKRVINCTYGAGTYSDYYPDEDVCDECATEEISADFNVGEEELELMGDWDD